MNGLYRVYSEWLMRRYGEKVYKIPVKVSGTCPHRDGTIGVGGCIFCGEKGGGLENLSETVSIRDQIIQTRNLIEKKYKAHRFIVFFQSFTNTYHSLTQLRAFLEEAMIDDSIVGIAIATRPDCIFEEQLEFFREFQERYHVDICIELGLQTANDHTLKIIHREHSLGDYLIAAGLIKKYGLQLCTHVILDLPWDDRQDVITTAEVLSAVQTDFVKCHALYVERGTILAQMYLTGEITLFDQEEYIERCMLFLEHLSPDIVLQRVIGRAPESDSVMTNWHISWWKVRDMLTKQMSETGRYQGRLFDQRRKAIWHHLSKG